MEKGMILIDNFSSAQLNLNLNADLDDYHRRSEYLMKNLKKIIIPDIRKMVL
jgi:hypothetical protein